MATRYIPPCIPRAIYNQPSAYGDDSSLGRRGRGGDLPLYRRPASFRAMPYGPRLAVLRDRIVSAIRRYRGAIVIALRNRPVVTLPAKLLVAAVWIACTAYCVAIWTGYAA